MSMIQYILLFLIIKYIIFYLVICIFCYTNYLSLKLNSQYISLFVFFNAMIKQFKRTCFIYIKDKNSNFFLVNLKKYITLIIVQNTNNTTHVLDQIALLVLFELSFLVFINIYSLYLTQSQINPKLIKNIFVFIRKNYKKISYKIN